MLPSPLQTHHAERRKKTSPAWTCRGCGRTSSDPENWSLSRRIWSHGSCYIREADPRHFLGLEPLQPLLRHPQVLCPANRCKKDLIHVLREEPIPPFNGAQALLPVSILHQLFNERTSFSSFFIHYFAVAPCSFPMLHPCIYFSYIHFCPFSSNPFLVIVLKFLLSFSHPLPLLSLTQLSPFPSPFFTNLSAYCITDTQYIILNRQIYDSIQPFIHPSIHPATNSYTHPFICPSAPSTPYLAVAGERCGALKWHLRVPLRRQWGFSTPWNTSPGALACLLFWWVLGELRVVEEKKSISSSFPPKTHGFTVAGIRYSPFAPDTWKGEYQQRTENTGKNVEGASGSDMTSL